MWLLPLFVILAHLVSKGQERKAQSVEFTQVEAAAIGDVRTLATAEFAYFYTYKRLACRLTDLGSSKDGSEGPNSSGLIYDDLASGQRNGYNYSIHCNGKASAQISAGPKPGATEKAYAFCTQITSDGKDANGGMIHYSDTVERCHKRGKVLP